MKLRQTLTIRLLDLCCVLHQLQRYRKQPAVCASEELIPNLRFHLLFGFGDSVPDTAEFLLPLRIRIDLLTKIAFFALLFSDQSLVGQSFCASYVDLQAVLYSKDCASNLARLLRAL